jgi:nuclear transport factor 2 (NTF2) superfamily protein
MKKIMSRIYNAEKQYKAFEKGWSFSTQNITARTTKYYSYSRKQWNWRNKVMKKIMNRIYNAEKQYKVFEKGWSFSAQNITGSDNKVLFMW